ncbi:MAG: hypothetical protein KDI06_06815 [Calditrichaeota bacterium]|nr:hypothetical protein [Calditrichota bacterium]
MLTSEKPHENVGSVLGDFLTQQAKSEVRGTEFFMKFPPFLHLLNRGTFIDYIPKNVYHLKANPRGRIKMAIEHRSKRLQVTLPEETVAKMDALLEQLDHGSRSGFLNKAALHYATRLQKAMLVRELRTGYKTRSERDVILSDDWEAADQL